MANLTEEQIEEFKEAFSLFGTFARLFLRLRSLVIRYKLYSLMNFVQIRTVMVQLPRRS